MTDDISRTLKSIGPPMIALNQYTQQVVKVSAEAIYVMALASSYNNNGIEAGFGDHFLLLPLTDSLSNCCFSHLTL
jgi:hypothetical protein